MFEFKVGLKTLLQDVLSGVKFYNDFVYQFRKIVSRTDSRKNLKKKCHSLQKKGGGGGWESAGRG